jgi:hypothetical protein
MADPARRAFDRQHEAIRRIAHEAPKQFLVSQRPRIDAWMMHAVKALEGLGRADAAAQLMSLDRRVQEGGHYNTNWAPEPRPYLDFMNTITSELNDAPDLAENFHEPKRCEFPETDAVKQVQFICDRFHAFAASLRTRDRNREPLMVEDEYDVQYLMNALLNMHFGDVRPEDQNERRASSSSRSDFFINHKGIIIETKNVTNDLLDKRVNEQLVLAIDRYKAKKSATHVICFVYDPNHLLEQPASLRDLNGPHAHLHVKVIVRPNR